MFLSHSTCNFHILIIDVFFFATTFFTASFFTTTFEEGGSALGIGMGIRGCQAISSASDYLDLQMTPEQSQACAQLHHMHQEAYPSYDCRDEDQLDHTPYSADHIEHGLPLSVEMAHHHQTDASMLDATSSPATPAWPQVAITPTVGVSGGTGEELMSTPATEVEEEEEDSGVVMMQQDDQMQQDDHSYQQPRVAEDDWIEELLMMDQTAHPSQVHQASLHNTRTSGEPNYQQLEQHHQAGFLAELFGY